MSYCELLGFKKGGFESIREYRNANGWTAFVWDSLFNEYVPKKTEYDSWLTGDPNKLWSLHNSEKLEDFERFVLRATFDRALVRSGDIEEFRSHLASFLKKYRKEDRVCHIQRIIDDLEGESENYIPEDTDD